MRLEAGELDKRVNLLAPSEAKDAYGNHKTEINVDLGTFWGKVSPISAKTITLAKGFSGTVTHEIKMRYRPNATNKCRVLVNGKTYHVNGVVHDIEKTWSQLFVTEVVE